MSVRDLGTFFHEYVHFLQNISTLWGIKLGITLNNLMCDLFTAVSKAQEIQIPFINYPIDPRTKLELDYYKEVRGCAGKGVTKNWMIDDSQKISISVTQDNTQKWPIPLNKVFLDVKFQDGRTERIQCGSTIVVESMAALCQSYIDPSAIHNDVPYNVVQVVANQHFPKIAQDKKKLICLCYIALFSMNPAWQLFDMMRYAENNIEKSGIDLFDEFVNLTNLKVHGKSISVIDFFDSIIDGYKKSIRGLIGTDIDYLNEILERVRLSENQAPLISVLNDEKPITDEHIEALINYLSIPFIQTANSYFYPGSTHSPEGSGDVAIMVGTYKIFEFLENINPSMKKVCPFVNLCAHDHEFCFDTPWREKGCTIEPALKKLGIYGKPIIYLDDLD